jgi:hypothetical protein
LREHVVIGADGDCHAEDGDEEEIKQEGAEEVMRDGDARGVGGSIEAVGLHPPPIRLV